GQIETRIAVGAVAQRDLDTAVTFLDAGLQDCLAERQEAGRPRLGRVQLAAGLEEAVQQRGATEAIVGEQPREAWLLLGRGVVDRARATDVSLAAADARVVGLRAPAENVGQVVAPAQGADLDRKSVV